MEDQDFDTLVDIVDRYDIDVVIGALRQVVEEAANDMVELGLNDKAKLMSLVAWNLRMFGNAPRKYDVAIEDEAMYPADVDGLCLSCGISNQYEDGFCQQCLDISNSRMGALGADEDEDDEPNEAGENVLRPPVYPSMGEEWQLAVEDVGKMMDAIEDEE